MSRVAARAAAGGGRGPRRDSVGIASLVEDVRKHKNFRQMASYSLQVRELLVPPLPCATPRAGPLPTQLHYCMPAAAPCNLHPATGAAPAAAWSRGPACTARGARTPQHMTCVPHGAPAPPPRDRVLPRSASRR